MHILLISLRNLFLMTLLLGGLYPLAVTALGKFLFPIRSAGSLIQSGERVIGSELIAQKFTGLNYFHPRPSAIDYGAQSSGASQKSATSADLKKVYEERRAALGPEAPADLLWASGSGLDPHISPEAATYQVSRVAQARGLSQKELAGIIKLSTEKPFLGFMGQPRVNVLNLNRLLDKKTER